jgi:hypothetical protein
MLTNVINGFINMTHGQILQYRTSPTDQYCFPLPKTAWRRPKSSNRDDETIQSLKTTSLQVYTRSQETQKKYSDSGDQDGFYCKIISELDSKVKRSCKVYRTKFKRNCYPSFGSISLRWTKTKLKKRKRLEK